jgi:hypothetical protein
MLDGGLGAVDKVNGAVPPWAIQLESGQRCLIVQGAHSVFDGRVIDYYCGRNVEVLRGLAEQQMQWQAQTVIWQASHYVRGRKIPIIIAWFGIPDRF